MDKRFKYIVYTDLFRTTGNASKKVFIMRMLKNGYDPGFKYIMYMRYCNYLLNKKKNICEKVIFKLVSRKFRKYQYLYGIEIPYSTDIKEGFMINHFGGIVVHGNAKIGKNCTMLQGVTIGNNIYKSRNDVAVIGDNVTISSGAKIIGNIKIGNNVTIGANAVVTKDIPDGAIVVGNPAKVISYKEPIVLNTNYMNYEEWCNIN